MTLKATQEWYVDRLRRRYLRALNASKVTQGLSTSNRLVAALGVIERANRPLFRRIGEYGFLLVNFLLYKLLGVRLLNITIGIYQVKLAHVFDFLEVQYDKHLKQLIVRSPTSVLTLLNVLALANDPHIVDWILFTRFGPRRWDNLTDMELHQIAAFYSGNLSLGTGLNYFHVLRELYSLAPDRFN